MFSRWSECWIINTPIALANFSNYEIQKKISMSIMMMYYQEQLTWCFPCRQLCVCVPMDHAWICCAAGHGDLKLGSWDNGFGKVGRARASLTALQRRFGRVWVDCRPALSLLYARETHQPLILFCACCIHHSYPNWPNDELKRHLLKPTEYE